MPVAIGVVHAEHQSQLLLRAPVRCQVDHLVSGVRCQVSGVRCKVTYHNKVAEVNSVPVLAEGAKGF